MKFIKKNFPLLIALAVLLVIGFVSPWGDIGRLLGRISPAVLFLLFGLSATYYVSKAFRFWYILRQLGVKVPLGQVMLVYFAAQPVSILPAGELYRSIMVEKYFGVKVRKTAPAITLQGLIEAIVLITFSLVGAFFLGQSRMVVVAIALVVLILILTLQRGWLLGKAEWINKLPFITISKKKYDQFIKDHQLLLKPTVLGMLIILSLFPVLCGVAILYGAAAGIDESLTAIEAAISYTLPVILSGISFLPGGVGVGEGGTIGLLYLFGISSAAAFTVTLLMRAFTLIAGIVYGFIAQVAIHFIMERR